MPNGETSEATQRIAVFGVGGGGCNAVRHLLTGADAALKIICANTDVQALRGLLPANRLQLGHRLTHGLGAGARPEIGRAAAQESLGEIERALDGVALCFIAAGMGGGTGTGAAPVIAKAARERGILTIGVATKPFLFEGTRRARVADTGLVDFEAEVDALITVCNEYLFRVVGFDTTFRAALAQSDSIVCESVNDFAALATNSATKRLTIADMRSVLAGGGRTVIGYGEHHFGDHRAVRAAESALSNPLLDGAAKGAGRLLVTVAGGDDLRLFEVEEAIAHVRAKVHPNAEIVWGSSTQAMLAGRVRVGIAAADLPVPQHAALPYTAKPLVAAPVIVELAIVEPVIAAIVACAAQVEEPAIAADAAIEPMPIFVADPAPVKLVFTLDADPDLALTDADIMRSTDSADEALRLRTVRPSLIDRIWSPARRQKRRSPTHAATLVDPIGAPRQFSVVKHAVFDRTATSLEWRASGLPPSPELQA